VTEQHIERLLRRIAGDATPTARPGTRSAMDSRGSLDSLGSLDFGPASTRAAPAANVARYMHQYGRGDLYQTRGRGRGLCDDGGAQDYVADDETRVVHHVAGWYIR
jgi:hypothetical protein